MNLMRHMLPLVALLAMLAMSLPLARLPRNALVGLGGGLFVLVMLEFYHQVLMFHAFRFGYWVS